MVNERKAGSKYYLSFGFTALILVSVTLVLVLVVLPQRYVLSAGLRESGVNFPATAIPFAPFAVTPQTARPVPEPLEILPGPAEVFWAELTPLLVAERYTEAVPLFEPYLFEFPNDLDVLREYATTLLAAGRVEDAIPILARLSESGDDTALRLLLARTLRDEGRLDEASTQYSLLYEASPDNQALALEWAEALAWAERYEQATVVLDGALRRDPTSVPLRLALARVHYSSGRLSHAALILATLPQSAFDEVEVEGLRADVMASLASPDPAAQPEPVALTLLEQAITARLSGDLERARTLYETTVREDPEDVVAWQAYADFLQFEVGDFEGALAALGEVERRTAAELGLRFRMAQLEIWTGRTDLAASRLEGMLASLSEGAAEPVDPTRPTDGDVITRADVRSLLGDLARWEGNRIRAASWYEAALADEPDNAGAIQGLEVLRTEVAQMISEVERPGAGVIAYTLGDTDEFSRVDLGAAWVGTRGTSVWAVRTGNRWLGGLDLSSAPGEQNGLYAELDAARWWRWGTVRTALHFGVQTVRAGGEDYSVGASMRFRGAGGRTVEVRYDHEPAYTLTGTLQSVFAELSQDRLSLRLARPLSDRWNLSVESDVALLEPRGLSTPDNDGAVRVQAAVTAGRAMTESVTAGVAARALSFTGPAPVRFGVPLFWDPRSVLSGGPYVQLGHRLSSALRATGRLTPGVAVIDERRTDGVDVVPHFSAEAGFEHTGDRFRTALGVFYYQGQFDGYRTYGLSLSLTSIDGFGGGGP